VLKVARTQRRYFVLEGDGLSWYKSHTDIGVKLDGSLPVDEVRIPAPENAPLLFTQFLECESYACSCC